MFSNAVVAALVALPFVAQSVLAGDCVRSYTIQEGDICDSISAEHKVSTYQLATINDGYINKACSNLVPGATICLGYENEDCNETHVVVANDTCEAIAKSYSIDEATLYNSNPNVLDDCSNIYIGEVLAVCTEVIIPPAGTAPVNTAVPVTATAVIDATSSAAPVTVAAPTVAAAPAALVPAVEETTDNEEYDEEYDDESLPYCDEL